MNIGALKDRSVWIFVTIGALIALLTLNISPVNYIKPPAQPTSQDGSLAHAAVTIKTQGAADAALRNGAIRGIDVSQYQGNINWSSVATDNVNYAMCRASFGMEADKYFYINMQGANNNGIAAGAYHYAKFTNRATMINEANYFISLLKNVDVTYPVVLDVEANRGMTKNTLTELSVEFMDMVRAEGYTVMLYSGTNFINSFINLSMVGDYELWVANYIEQPKIEHKMWQHTSYGSVKGISGRVDINVAYSGLAPKKAGITVDRDISYSIKEMLNSRYNAGLPIEGLDMARMHEAIITGLQTELNSQMGANLSVTGQCDQDTLNALDGVAFIPGQTGGNITYLMQAALFYRGLYTNSLSSQFDDHTISALQGYQKSYQIQITGTPDYETLRNLFY